MNSSGIPFLLANVMTICCDYKVENKETTVYTVRWDDLHHRGWLASQGWLASSLLL